MRHPVVGARRSPEVGPAPPWARLDNHDPRSLFALDPQHGKARRRRHGRDLGLKSTADLLLTKPPMSVSGALTFYGFCRRNEEPTSGLEPLTCSSYECAVAYIAAYHPVRKRRINKPNLGFRKKQMFTVYRRIPPILSSRLSSTSDPQPPSGCSHRRSRQSREDAYGRPQLRRPVQDGRTERIARAWAIRDVR